MFCESIGPSGNIHRARDPAGRPSASPARLLSDFGVDLDPQGLVSEEPLQTLVIVIGFVKSYF